MGKPKHKYVKEQKLYEIWVSSDGGEVSLVAKDSQVYDYLIKDVTGADMILSEIFMARTIQYARKIYNQFMDKRDLQLSQVDK